MQYGNHQPHVTTDLQCGFSVIWGVISMKHTKFQTSQENYNYYIFTFTHVDHIAFVLDRATSHQWEQMNYRYNMKQRANSTLMFEAIGRWKPYCMVYKV